MLGYATLQRHMLQRGGTFLGSSEPKKLPWEPRNAVTPQPTNRDAIGLFW
jgi:hypothetical protein